MRVHFNNGWKKNGEIYSRVNWCAVRTRNILGANPLTFEWVGGGGGGGGGGRGGGGMGDFREKHPAELTGQIL